MVGNLENKIMPVLKISNLTAIILSIKFLFITVNQL